MAEDDPLHALADTITALDWLADHADDLWKMRMPDVARPRRMSTPLTARQRAHIDAKAREESADMDEYARTHMPGYTAAPVRVDILDVHVDLLSRAAQLTDAIDQLGLLALDQTEPPTPPASSYADPAPHLMWSAAWLRDAHDTDPAILRHAAWAEPMRQRIAAILGELDDGQILRGVCPFCHGATPDQQTGGDYTLTFRTIGSTVHTTVLVCSNPLCDPPRDQCGTRWRGQPAWPFHQWDWLSRLIDTTTRSAQP